jgi:hypothetical protein
MDLYQCIVPKPADTIYTLDSWTGPCTNLGVFDELETALHALDVVSKFRANDLKRDDYFAVARMSKNTLIPRPRNLVIWRCTGEPVHGCFIGKIELQHNLRTHDVQNTGLKCIWDSPTR